MLQTMGQFNGLSSEDPHLHLKLFLEVSDTFKIAGATQDVLRLRLFPYSLKDRVRALLNSLSSDSITTWNDLAAQVTSLTNMVKAMTSAPAAVEQVAELSCVYCGEGHDYIVKNEAIVQSQAVSMRNLENQIGQLATVMSRRFQGSLPSNTEDLRKKGKKHCKVINLRSGKNVDILVDVAKKRVELNSSQEQLQVERMLQQPSHQDTSASSQVTTTLEGNHPKTIEEDVATPVVTTHNKSKEQIFIPPKVVQQFRHPPPFLQRFQKQKQDKQFSKFLEVLKQLHINIPFVEALEQMPNYVKFLKDILARKIRLGEFETVALTQECSHMLQSKIPKKLKDLESFTIQCSIGARYNGRALCDLGASINLMSLFLFKQLGVGECRPTTVTLQLADISHAYPKGKIKDVLVKVDKFIFLVDFIVLDFEADKENNTLPVIISSSLDAYQERSLVDVLGKYKKLIRWTMEDIKGISPSICMHKILLEDFYSNSVEQQRRLNPIIKEVVKKEIIKCLDKRIIYPISDSSWVRKLSKATRNDHFPLPFIDQMLDKLAEKQYYCFLDAYSGYNQIAIDPEDWENTTFTCPYETFTFRRMPFDHVIRRCVSEEEIPHILQSCHAAAYRGHFGGQRIAAKVLQSGPFPTSFGNLYILVAVDYVSKWVKTAALPINNARAVVNFLEKNIFFRTTYKTPLGMSPYRIMYGKACHLPLELERKAYWALKQLNWDIHAAAE
ncbi:hypothetical protein KPL71_014117 [Citrus sinensis]|uniref:Uncharacterized protein n=1 Tax=Citrus sinensis TaxID=2711 RepID=A0ACB8K9G2_CITSI|nr:hypothetical protein KPL71_014117 [Citrus sinensis]